MKRWLPFAIALLLPAAAEARSNAVVNMSHYDLMRVNFPQMVDQQIVGLIHEATYPPYVRDDKYFGRQVAATRAGLLWGAYHFANARDPVRQADHFLSVVESSWRRADRGGRPDGILLVLDFEKNGHYPGGTMRVDQAITFIQRIKQRTGKYPGLYSNEHRVKTVLNSPKVTARQREILQHCWLWVANYHKEPGSMRPWPNWKMWQYTGDGICDLPRRLYPKHIANVRNAERNLFYGTRDELKRWWSIRAWHPGGESAADVTRD